MGGDVNLLCNSSIPAMSQFNFPLASVFTVCFKWKIFNSKVFVLDTNVLMHHLEVAEVIFHIIIQPL